MLSSNFIACLLAASLAGVDSPDRRATPIGLDELHARTPGTLHAFLPAPGVDPEALDADTRKAIEPVYRIDHNFRTETGLLRVFERLRRPEVEWEMFMAGFEPNCAFIPESWWAVYGWRDAAQAADMRAIRQTWVADRDDIVLGVNADDVSLDAGIQILLPDDAAPDTEAHGIIVHLNALMPNEYEARALAGLVDAGWAVVQIDVRAQIDPPNRRAIDEATARLNALRNEIFLREQEALRAEIGREEEDAERALFEQASLRAQEQVEIPESAFVLRAGDDLEVTGGRIARAADITLAQNADAAAAVVAFLDGHRPDLSGKPIIIAGFSAGALAAPAVAARLGERVAAMILIGGGADLFTIARDSTLTTGGLDLTPIGGPAPDEAVLDELARLYRERTLLDPFAAAPSLAGIPTLVVLGSFDKTVPSAQGRLLLDRLEGEEAIWLPLTHNGLFGVLGTLSGRIASWVETNVAFEAPNDEP